MGGGDEPFAYAQSVAQQRPGRLPREDACPGPGELQVSVLAYPYLEVVRTAKLVRQSDPEVYQINYFRGGRGTMSLPGVTRRCAQVT